MKKLTIVLALCLMGSTVSLCAQKKEKITQERSVGTFTGIDVSEGIKVKVKPGASTKVRVLSTTDVVEDVRTEVVDGILIIEYHAQDVVDPKKKMSAVVEVTTMSLSSIKASVSGELESPDAMDDEDLVIDVSADAKISVNTKAKSVKVNASSKGEVTIKGTTELADFAVTTKGKISAKGLKSVNANVVATSEGQASITASKEFTVSSTGKAQVEYSGDPQVTQTSNTGGKVTMK